MNISNVEIKSNGIAKNTIVKVDGKAIKLVTDIKIHLTLTGSTAVITVVNPKFDSKIKTKHTKMKQEKIE